MNAFIHEGIFVTVPAPYEVNDGDGVLVGALFGVALSWSKCGDPVDIKTTGVFDLPKLPDETWAVGNRVYWDETSKRATTSSGPLPCIGIVMEETRADRPDVGRVRINGVAL